MRRKSRETVYGSSVRAAAERTTEARKAADRLAVEAWNKRMLGFQGLAQPHVAFQIMERRCLRSSHDVNGLMRVATEATKISADDLPSTSWPGER